MAQAIKMEATLVVGHLETAAEELLSGLSTHGVSQTPELKMFLSEWMKSHTVTSRGTTIEDLRRRLSEYECPIHEEVDFECEGCQRHIDENLEPGSILM